MLLAQLGIAGWGHALGPETEPPPRKIHIGGSIVGGLSYVQTRPVRVRGPLLALFIGGGLARKGCRRARACIIFRRS